MQRPNFLIFVMDTQRARNMSCYGYRRNTTPNVDALGAEGVVFENHFTPGVWTVPVHASLFTGKYVSGHGCGTGHEYLEDDFPTLAEVLNAHGYITAGFSNNGWVETEKTRVARGFADYTLARLARPIGPFLPETDPDKGDKGSWVTVGLVRQWLDEYAQADAPFLLFINCVEPHMRYWPPQPFRGQFLLEGVDEECARRIPQLQFQGTTGQVILSPEDWEIVKSLRDGETACLDHRMGLMLDYMREKGILDNTVVFILGDHGDSTGEHGTHTGHCQTGIWDTVLHTPLVVRGPSLPEGKRVQHLVQTVDIFPTILDIAEIQDQAVGGEIQGTSLLRALGAEPIREFAVAEIQKPLEPFAFMKRWDPDFDPRAFNRLWKCARTLDYKYVWASDGRDELYDIVKDRDEQQNIIEKRPEIAAKLRKKLEEFLLDLDQRDYGDFLNMAQIGRHVGPEVTAHMKAWGLLRDVVGARRWS